LPAALQHGLETALRLQDALHCDNYRIEVRGSLICHDSTCAS
jgi:hypothetical protein